MMAAHLRTTFDRLFGFKHNIRLFVGGNRLSPPFSPLSAARPSMGARSCSSSSLPSTLVEASKQGCTVISSCSVFYLFPLLSPGDTVMDVKQHLQNASKNLEYNLVLRDKKDEPLKDHIKISDVADISTRDCRLEMVAVPNHDRSIMTNIHQTGVSSSLAQNTSSKLEGWC